MIGIPFSRSGEDITEGFSDAEMETVERVAADAGVDTPVAESDEGRRSCRPTW